MSKPIPPLDLMWFIMETQASPTHVGVLLLFEKPAGRPHVVHEIVEAYRSHTPTSPFDYIPDLTSMPRFRKAPHYDPLYHVQHLSLPAGSSHDDLLRLVADLHEPMLDRDRPLFRDWFIDGVPGGRFALYAKVHHGIIDGVSGVQRIYAGLNSHARRTVPPPAFAADLPVRKPRPPKALTEKIAEIAGLAKRQTFALRDLSLQSVKKRTAQILGALPAGTLSFAAQHGPMNEPMRMSRSFATLSLPLEEMRAVGKRHDATLNDVAVTIVDEGVHRYLRATERDFDHRLVAMCPMSLRDEHDIEAGTKASAMFVHLGAPASDVIQRLPEVVAALKTAKDDLRSMSKDAAMLYATATLGIAGFASATRIDRVTPPLANIVISNVPGRRDRMYLDGAPVVGMFPVSAIAMSIGLNATLTSYHDRMDFGFVGNGSTMHELPLLARCVHEAFDELKAGASKRRPARKHSAQRRRAASARADG